MRATRLTADAIVGIGIALLGVAFAVATMRIDVQPVYAKVGPTFVPWLVSAGLVVTGSLMAWAGLHGTPKADDAVKTEWRPVAWIFAGLLADWLLFKPAGFIIASTVLFFCVARGFGSRSVLWDALVGAALSITAYLLFRYGLHLTLPGLLAGIWR